MKIKYVVLFIMVGLILNCCASVQMTQQTFSVSILPYVVRNGKNYFLLGQQYYQSLHDSGRWVEFSGISDVKSDEAPEIAAASDFVDETAGVFDAMSVRHALEEVGKFRLSDGRIHTIYVLNLHDQSPVVSIRNRANAEMLRENLEKIDWGLFPADELLNNIDQVELQRKSANDNFAFGDSFKLIIEHFKSDIERKLR